MYSLGIAKKELQNKLLSLGRTISHLYGTKQNIIKYKIYELTIMIGFIVLKCTKCFIHFKNVCLQFRLFK